MELKPHYINRLAIQLRGLGSNAKIAVILKSKLENLGVRGAALNFISSFLSNHSQSVFYNEQLSAPLVIKYGCVQGSLL